MGSAPDPQVPQPATLSPGQVALTGPIIRSGARWFWWIAGLRAALPKSA
jgi:hypothetical protein